MKIEQQPDFLSVMNIQDSSLLAEMKGWIRKGMEKADYRFLSKRLFDQACEELNSLDDILPRQLIHRDVHPGNFLFEQGVFNGYIDFDLSQRNIRIFDLCYFLLGQLGFEGTLMPADEWLKLVKDTFAGYESLVPMEPSEKLAVPCVMECIEALFTSWYLGMNMEKEAADAAGMFAFVERVTVQTDLRIYCADREKT